MARLFFSFLGTSSYVPCSYRLGDRSHPTTRFVQTAVLHLVCADWSAGDRVIIGCTAEARKGNLPDLQGELSASGWPLAPDVVDLPNATSEEELWEIFQSLFAKVNDGDELVFDITHSFRSLPMLFTVLIQYLGVVRHVRLRGVYYGAFERLGRPPEVASMPLEQRDVPIIDLTPFFDLYRWSASIDHFLRFGSTEDLQRLVSGHINPILRETRGADANARSLRKVVESLGDFARSVQYVRGKELCNLSFRSNIVSPLSDISSRFLPQLSPVLDRLADAFSGWPDKDTLNALRAVRWCIEHDLVQQGLTLLQESLVGYWVDRCEDLLDEPVRMILDLQKNILWKRNFISALLAVLSQGKGADAWTGTLSDHRDIAHACASRIPGELIAEYGKLTRLRNDVNHGGFIYATKHKDLRSGLESSYQIILEKLKQVSTKAPRQGPLPSGGLTYFVSRHPGAKAWAEEEGIRVDAFIDHLEVERIEAGDVVVGSLPVNYAAEVCRRGARYLHLSLQLTPELRGKELTATEMRECGARVEEYCISSAGQPLTVDQNAR